MMKTIPNLLVLALISITSLSYAGEFEKTVEKFNSVEANGNYKMFLTKGEENKVKVINNEPELEDSDIEVKVKGAELQVDIKGNLFKKLELKIYVTYTSLVNIKAKGGAWVKVENPIEGSEVELSCTTDGIISAELACESVKASILTSGDIKLRGKVGIAEYKVNAGGFISAINAEADKVEAKVATGGEISCLAKEKMTLKVSMGGTIKYKFEGEEKNLKKKVSLGGTIKELKN